MSNRLKIYACSGIGETNRAKAWISEDTNAATNTQGMNAILAIINSLAVDLRYPENLTEKEIIATYNALDLYSVAFYYARLYRDASETLATVGNCIAKYIADGGFNSKSTRKEWHDQLVDSIIDDIDAMVASGDIQEQAGDFAEWWKKTVVDGNVVGLQQDGKIGATIKEDYGDLNKYLYDGGTYFIWLYFPKEKRNELPYRIRRKIRKQQEVYDYCKKCFCPEYGGIYGSEETMQRIIRNGIKEDFKGSTPEEVCETLLERERVGDWIAALISALVTLILGILSLVIDYASAVAVAKYAVPEDPESGCPDEEDVYSFGNVRIKKRVVWLTCGAAVLYYLWKQNN